MEVWVSDLLFKIVLEPVIDTDKSPHLFQQTTVLIIWGCRHLGFLKCKLYIYRNSVFNIIYFKMGFFILNNFHKDAYHYLCMMRLYRLIKAKNLQGKGDDKLMIHP